MKTVYVVGAGASYEARLPTVNDLKYEIASLLNMNSEAFMEQTGDSDILQALNLHVNRSAVGLEEYKFECRHISSNMPLAMSIDNFIDTEKENEKLALCGKLAIVRSILEAERNSLLYADPHERDHSINFASLENTWYLSFFRTLAENCNVQDIPERFSDIALIIFNYDRCIEHFLLAALKSYYRLEEDVAAELISNLSIYHPYGTVGPLSWRRRGSNTYIDFGGRVDPSRLVEYAQSIRTFTEGADSEQIPDLKASMNNAERLVFLGFAFHRLNMKLIAGVGEVIDGYENPSEIKCYATAYKASESDQESIQNSINHLYHNRVNIEIENTTCAELFHNYSRSLGYK